MLNLKLKLFMKKLSLILNAFLLLAFTSQAQTLTLTPSDYNGYNISCFGQKNGSIDLSISGGTPPYTVNWSNSETTEDILNLDAGYYVVRVDDSDPLTDPIEAEITLTEPNKLSFEASILTYPNGKNISLHGACNGSLTLTPIGGVAPFTFSWQDGSTAQNRTSLCSDNYQVRMIDQNGCEADEGRFYLTEPERSDWQMTGNYNTDPATQFIGTVDNKDLVFKTNNSEVARMKSNGEFAVHRIITDRIVSPDQVDGTIYFGDNTMIIQTLTNRIYGNPAGNVYKGTGIGANTLPKGLHSLAAGWGCTTDVNATSSVVLGYNLGTNTANTIVIGSGFGNQISGKMNNNLSNSIYLGCNSNIPTMVITEANGLGTTGCVGIGMTPNASDNSLSYKLVVNGKLGVKEAWVSLGSPWPDYVFGEDYNLPDLITLKDFVNENNHLPGMPSAEEIALNEKINLGEIQVKSLEKIEELYLYIFKLQTEIESMKMELNSLK